ncbi:MAG: peptidylprolyl isomerase [Candidatus Woesearchaeota archaeon]
MANQPRVRKGDTIKVDYTGTFDDGSVFDSSAQHGQPLEFEVGAGMMIKGFDQAVLGMKLQEEKTVHIPTIEAYGDHDAKLIKQVPRERLPSEQEIKPGMMLAISTNTGQKFPALITDVDDKIITIDLNHPLAGKHLTFKIKVVEISSPA